jgi:hypothetical protein
MDLLNLHIKIKANYYTNTQCENHLESNYKYKKA